MAYITIPSRRYRQPQGVVRADNKWLARDLVGLVSPTYWAAVDHVAKLTATTFGTPSVAAGSQGIALSSDATAGYIFTGQSYFSTVYTHVALVELSSVDTWGGIFAVCSTDGNESTVALQRVDSSNDLAIFHATVETAQTYTNAYSSVVDGRPHVLAFSSDGTAARDFYLDGRLLTPSVSGSSAPTSISSARLVLFGARNADAANSSAGKYYLHAVFNKKLSASEIYDISRNPWQLFAPEPRRLLIGPSGSTGGTIFESTFADSWSLSETYASKATLVSSYADTPTLTDSVSSKAVFASTFAETIPVSDGPSADVGGTANRTYEDSFSITDSYSANLTAVVTIAETLSVTDSKSASAVFNAAVAETVPIVDGEAADAGRISDIAESVAISDAYSSNIVANATLAETSDIEDTYDTIAILNPSISETLPITDAMSATTSVTSSGTIDLSTESIEALAYEIMVQLTSTPVRKL